MKKGRNFNLIAIVTLDGSLKLFLSTYSLIHHHGNSLWMHHKLEYQHRKINKSENI